MGSLAKSIVPAVMFSPEIVIKLLKSDGTLFVIFAQSRVNKLFKSVVSVILSASKVPAQVEVNEGISDSVKLILALFIVPDVIFSPAIVIVAFVWV
ncbi:hypothetical protein ES703_115130 [subsurface metagenome]